MATIGSLTEFAEGDGDWIEYVERLEHFFLANDISDEGKKGQFFSVRVERGPTS